jgi:hypothetical protein
MKFAVTLRPTDPTLHYNCACTYAKLGMKADAMDSLRKARDLGYSDAVWVRRERSLAQSRLFFVCARDAEVEQRTVRPTHAAPPVKRWNQLCSL